ncbi:ATP-binding protein [Pseudotenacibaculum sp. MALMAid0570]|uniref:ATP-binding protein n=1 Tax=Pseudotenacibaculum sp. MALMAid0570 TaxID=3143938 RepID=UPI0032DF1C7E
MQKKIVLIGGPGTGKSTVLNELEKRGFHCMPEVSREVTIEAQKKGIQQLFLTEPILFSKMLLEGRERQYLEAEKINTQQVFFDRGLPDVYAYMEYTKEAYPEYFKEKCLQYKYDHVFLFSPWREIYTSDNERYESFEESTKIDLFLQNAYRELGYTIVSVPFGSVDERVNFILNWLKLNV